MKRAARRAPANHSQLMNPKDFFGILSNPRITSLYSASWKCEQSPFQVTLHENGSLNGWWMKIWIGAGKEPSCAEECLDLFQNIILLSWEPSHASLTADSIVCENQTIIREIATRRVILPMDFFLLS
jgi:hypothetical protein